MSIAGFAGSGWVAQQDEVRRSLERLRYVEDAAIEVIARQGVVLGATNDSQLWEHTESGTIVAWSGALYDREATAALLGYERSASAAEIACRAFVQMGLASQDKLWGEYALAVWDAPERRLLLVRDAMARRPLTHAWLGDGVAFASEGPGLLRWKGIDPSFSEEHLARMMTMQPSSSDETLYKSLYRIDGGHALLHRTGQPPQTVEHWKPTERPQLLLKDWREYGVAIREAMAEAVRVRLPERGQVASQLSSGFDSSGVTALVAEQLAQQGRTLLAYTSVPVKPTENFEILGDRFANEWPLASQVAAMYPNIQHIAIPTNYGSLFEALDWMSDHGGGPAAFIRNSQWYYGILNEAAKRGAVTMFEGQAGNLTSSYNGGFDLYDLRRRGQWMAFAAHVRGLRRNGMGWLPMLRAAWMPGRKANAMLDRVRGRKPIMLHDVSLIRREFYERLGLQVSQLSAMGTTIDGDRSTGSSWRASIARKAEMGMMHAAHRRGFGMEREDPTADRKLVELVLSIPDAAFAPEGKRRELYREGFRGHLPAELLGERYRGLQSGDFLHHFEQEVPAALGEVDRLEGDTLVASLIDLPRMRSLLQNFHTLLANKPKADQTFNYTVGGALALGRFLRRAREAGNAVA